MLLDLKAGILKTVDIMEGSLLRLYFSKLPLLTEECLGAGVQFRGTELTQHIPKPTPTQEVSCHSHLLGKAKVIFSSEVSRSISTTSRTGAMA